MTLSDHFNFAGAEREAMEAAFSRSGLDARSENSQRYGGEIMFRAGLRASRAGWPDEGERERAAESITDQQSFELVGYRQTEKQKRRMVDAVLAALGAVAASPDERQVDPVIPSSGAAWEARLGPDDRKGNR